MMVSFRPTAGDKSALREPGAQDVAADSQKMRGLHLIFVAKAIGFGHDRRIDALVEFRSALFKQLHQYALKRQESGLVGTGSFGETCLAP
jgi:hypothetical protein